MQEKENKGKNKHKHQRTHSSIGTSVRWKTQSRDNLTLASPSVPQFSFMENSCISGGMRNKCVICSNKCVAPHYLS